MMIAYIILTIHLGINLKELILDSFYLFATSLRRVQCFGCGRRTTIKSIDLKLNENIWNCSSCDTENQVVGSGGLQNQSLPMRHECKNAFYCLVCTSNNRKNLEMVRSRKKKSCTSDECSVFCRECLHNQQIFISALAYDSPPVSLLIISID